MKGKGEEAGSPNKSFSCPSLPCPARPNSSPQLRLIVLWQGQKFRRRESTIDLPSSAMAEHRKHRKLRIALCHPDLGIGTSPHNQTRLNLALYSRRCLSFKTSTLSFKNLSLGFQTKLQCFKMFFHTFFSSSFTRTY